MLAFLVYIALLGFHYRKLINLLEILKFQIFSHFIPSVSPFVPVFIKIIFEFCIFQHITRKFGSELQKTALEKIFIKITFLAIIQSLRFRSSFILTLKDVVQ